jgi:hypothetical protein
LPALPGWLQGLAQQLGGGQQRERGGASVQQVARHCFPAQLSVRGDGGSAASTSGRQELLSVGSRQWGHPAISSLLRVKIYDFALYMDGAQVHFSPVHPLFVRLLN